MRVFAILFLFYAASAEIYSAVSELDKLLNTEKNIIGTMEEFVLKSQELMRFVKREMRALKLSHETNEKTLRSSLANPVTSYLLIKRVAVDWAALGQSVAVYSSIANETLLKLDNLRDTSTYPTEEDLRGSAKAIYRVQDVYNLQPQDIMNGQIKKFKFNETLTGKDCYDLGLFAFQLADFYHAKLWISETRRVQVVQNVSRHQVPHHEVLEHLAYSHYMEGDYELALNITEELLRIHPDHPRALTNKKSISEKINTSPKNAQLKTELLAEFSSVDWERELYAKTCRNEMPPRGLRCRYKNHSPFLKLAPLKEEEVLLNPRIVVFRDVLSESEISVIKTFGLNRLTRSKTVSSDGGMVSDWRVSQFGWMAEGESPVLTALRRRVEDMTSLSTESAESLQVVDYGIGGHYIVHEDYIIEECKNDSRIDSLGTGNRIATVLFYMSEAVEGGRTVFPRLGVGVQPTTGTALIWYNLHEDGQGDPRTRHAACPLLVGSKWVATMWLHERGQEFRRPCALRPDHLGT